jgi:nicotinamidase-related amidase
MSDWKMEGKPALLILHMQKGIVGQGNEFSPQAAKVTRDSGIIPRQQALLKAFRDRKLPVIYVNVVKKPPVTGTFPTYGFLWKEMATEKPDAGGVEVIPELAPRPGEPVLINWPFGGFNNSGLEQTLRVCGVQTLVPAGFATNGVVLSVILGAADRYYSVVVPSDASASVSAEAHKAVMEIIAPASALVTTTEDIIAHL